MNRIRTSLSRSQTHEPAPFGLGQQPGLTIFHQLLIKHFIHLVFLSVTSIFSMARACQLPQQRPKTVQRFTAH